MLAIICIYFVVLHKVSHKLPMPSPIRILQNEMTIPIPGITDQIQPHASQGDVDELI
jgi:hypothetical protein